MQGVSALLGLGTIFLGTSASLADIIEDGSTPSRVINSSCLGFIGCTIIGGHQQGNHLFHSFSEFIIPPDGDALLIPPFIPEKIFIRVVGPATEIHGSFRVPNIGIPTDIIFLSPQGIRISENAQLAYPGNFLFSTAERLDFANGAIFDATDSSIPLLDISGLDNLPQALQLGNSSGVITLNSSIGLENIKLPQTQHQFSVIGGEINFNAVELSTVGELHLSSVGQNQTVGLDFLESGIDFDYSMVSSFEDISLNNARLSTSSLANSNGDAGNIELEARNLTLNNASEILAETASSQGNITVELRGDLFVIGDASKRSQIMTQIADTTGAAGNISISANDIFFERGLLSSSTDQPGGAIEINAANTIQLNQSEIRLSSKTGTGHTGNLNLTAQSAVTPIGISLTETDVLSEATNTGGDVRFSTPGEVELRDGSFISIDSSGTDGNFTVTASAFRSSGIADDNDVQLNQGTLGQLSLPADVTGFDVLASQIIRSNGNSELLPNPFPVPVAPSPPVLPSPILPVIPSPPIDPIVEPLETPANPVIPSQAEDNDLPTSLALTYPQSNGENLQTIESLLSFYGSASLVGGEPPWSCSVAAGSSYWKISGRGGISSPPSSLNGNSAPLADLGSREESLVSARTSYVPRLVAPLSARSVAPSQNWREARSWKQAHQGKIELRAESDLVLTHAKTDHCQSLQ